MNVSDLANELSERGIWWQIGGFTITGCVSVAILQIWAGSEFWAYRSFEIATKDLYWLFILPLAGLIEGVRKLFEKASEIRAAQRARIVERARNRGRQEGHREGRKEALAEVRDRLHSAAEQFQQKDPATGAPILTPEVIDFLLGESTDAGA